VKRWRRAWQRYRRQNRFLIGLYLGLLVLSAAGFVLFSTMRHLPPEELTNRLLTFLLWWFDLTLIAIVLFVLFRNFIKLALERHYGILGSRFRTKLLLSYLVLILAPAALLFLLGVSLLSHAAASWFSAPVEGMAQAGARLAEEVRSETEARVERMAGVVAHALGRLSSERERLNELGRLHALLGSHLTGWIRDGVPVVELVDPHQRMLTRLPALDPSLLAHNGAQRERFGGTVVTRAWELLPDGTAVVVGEAQPEALVKEQGKLAEAGATYERLKLERPTITATAVLGFGALALVVVFAAMWLGLRLSRRFTEPLLALVATTQRVAGGDTLAEVPIPAEDEVGLLVNSFNAMVRRLREQEEELRSTVRRLDAVLGAVRTGVLTLDARRDRVIANPAGAALLGLPHLAEDARALDELREAGLGKLVDTIRTAEAGTRGSLTVQQGAVARTLEVAVVPLGQPEEPHGWVVAIEDLTQLLRAQRQAAWSEVARRIAHQIKNPLTPIRLAAERMARHVERGAGDLDEVVPQGCHAIVEHVQAMQEMVNAFSRYAKLPPVVRRPVAVSGLLRQVVALYDGMRSDLAVRFDDGTDGREGWLDPEQFRQVLTNLLDNAVEASSGRGEVVVRSRWSGDYLEVEVIDEGSGVPLDDPELLFQPFYSTKGRGSGVGLAVVQRIVSDHGGTVRLEPNSPRGVRAVVRVPGSES
jgi:two-component system, NtrC family, nitrogen regulation sensor histidine kinase NtrY